MNLEHKKTEWNMPVVDDSDFYSGLDTRDVLTGFLIGVLIAVLVVVGGFFLCLMCVSGN